MSTSLRINRLFYHHHHRFEIYLYFVQADQFSKVGRQSTIILQLGSALCLVCLSLRAEREHRTARWIYKHSARVGMLFPVAFFMVIFVQDQYDHWVLGVVTLLGVLEVSLASVLLFLAGKQSILKMAGKPALHKWLAGKGHHRKGSWLELGINS